MRRLHEMLERQLGPNGKVGARALIEGAVGYWLSAAQNRVWVPKRYQTFPSSRGLETQSENETKCTQNNREWVLSLNGCHLPGARLPTECFSCIHSPRPHFTDKALAAKIICPWLHQQVAEALWPEATWGYPPPTLDL